MQATTCKRSRTKLGRAFSRGALATRGVVLDPCKPQPITLIAEAHVEVGTGAAISHARPAWQRIYEHGMALTSTVTERLDESRAVLEVARAKAPDDRARAMIAAQLGWVASRQGRADDALAEVATARSLLAKAAGHAMTDPPVLDAIEADALSRVWRWEEALAPAKKCTELAPRNARAWVVYARVLGSLGRDTDALAATAKGLALSPRDQDLLRSQATALTSIAEHAKDPRRQDRLRGLARDALAAFDRYRSPDRSADLRIQCAADSPRCARDRESGHTLVLHPTR